MRLGIMGGTFDPIHYGHLFVAEEARARFGLEKVLFLPNAHPPHKKAYPVTEARHRYDMAQLAIRDNAAFECSPLELQRPGPSYTVDTLAALRAERPGAELYYITGMDAIAEILTWNRPQEVIQMATFIAAARPGFDSMEWMAALPNDYRARILLLGSTALGISSTDIRQRIATGLPVRYLTPDEVLDYIQRHRLYRDGPGSEDS
ncbi:MAG TPA: nicotinate-nucleotide adenylyltransferase [Chthonomonadaceae bacterium]|nr:nicotinate-nucleotide adenylyltransferase [Chthonomonadaceae bacterium]